MKKVYKFLFILHIFVGLGAIGGGFMAILNPQSPGGMPIDSLKNSPFTNFLIPGVILFTVIGLGNIFSALLMKIKSRYKSYISVTFSFALVIWIIVQCIMLRVIVHLHIIFFIIALIQVGLSIIIMFKEKVFPTNIILKFIMKLNNSYVLK